MNARIPAPLRAKWLEMLRSGEYKQGIGRLMQYDELGSPSFCCLGVLCLAAGEPLEALNDRGLPTLQFATQHGIYSNSAHCNFRVTIRGVEAALSDHNDSHKRGPNGLAYSSPGKPTFAEIADAIEQQTETIEVEAEEG